MARIIADHDPEPGGPPFWAAGLALACETAARKLGPRNRDDLGAIEPTPFTRQPPDWTTPNRILIDLYRMQPRDFSRGEGGPVLILLPDAGQSARQRS